jgi:hypothetical protein
MGLKITKDKYYKTIVKFVNDEWKSILLGENFAASFNFPYEQFIFAARDKSFEKAIKTL